MVSLEEAVIARLDRHGERFEILIEPSDAQKYKEGVAIDILASLAAEEIFKSSSRGDRASEESIQKVFGTIDVALVAEEILTKGDIKLTQTQRKKMRQKKKDKIVDIIVRNAINPQTKTPHPRKRIELAIEEAKIKIDPFKSADSQINDVLDKLKILMPIKFDTIVMAVRLSAPEYGRCYGEIKDMGKLTREEWQKDGNWIGIVQIPAGLKLEFFDRLNAKTHGEASVKILD